MINSPCYILQPECPPRSRVQTPRFTRTVAGPVVHLSSTPRLDVVPPSRIGDLLISLADNKETAINNPDSKAQNIISA